MMWVVVLAMLVIVSLMLLALVRARELAARQRELIAGLEAELSARADLNASMCQQALQHRAMLQIAHGNVAMLMQALRSRGVRFVERKPDGDGQTN